MSPLSMKIIKVLSSTQKLKNVEGACATSTSNFILFGKRLLINLLNYLSYIPSTENVADIMTKTLRGAALSRYTTKMGIGYTAC